MAKTFQCEVITPQDKVLDGAAVQAVIPAWDGLLGVLPNRAPLVTKLGLGELRLDFPDEGGSKGGSRSFFVDDGFAQMVGDRLTVLAALAIPCEELVESDAQAELAEAEARQLEGLDERDAARIRRERDRARVKLRLAKTFKARGGGI